MTAVLCNTYRHFQVWVEEHPYQAGRMYRSGGAERAFCATSLLDLSGRTFEDSVLVWPYPREWVEMEQYVALVMRLNQKARERAEVM